VPVVGQSTADESAAIRLAVKDLNFYYGDFKGPSARCSG
jgi:phosphate transport system ATP-binding protein